MFKNTPNHYGLISIILHWLIAAFCIALFVLGIWMVRLDYYDAYYTQAPYLHKSLGLVLLPILSLRLCWNGCNPRVAPEPAHTALEKRLARPVHLLLNTFILLIIISGYLISTADGKSIAIFDWLDIPASITDLAQQESRAGAFHRWLAYLLATLVVLHSLAALKHHIIDRDNTLNRMIGRNRK
jgi:cytochrome b561